MSEDTSDLGSTILSIRHKIVFVGDVSVGKTSVMTRFIENSFKEKYDPTIGVDFFSKNIEFRESSLKLQIWDSAGQERYKSLIPSYVRGASIIFIVYDVSRKDTFTNVPAWVNFIKDVKVDGVVLALCGNKTDLNRQVDTIDGENLARKEGMLYYEVSAKTGGNVVRMFYSAISELPFFEQFNVGNKKKIIEDLEIKNKAAPEQNFISNIVNEQANQLNVKDAKCDTQRPSGCKC